MNKLKHFAVLCRLPNSIMAGSGVILGYLCLPGPLQAAPAMWGFLSLTLLAMGGNIQNDVKDVVTDTYAHPERPLVLGYFSPADARILYLICFSLGLITAGIVSFKHGILAFIIIILLWLYNHSLKGRVLAGNIIISLLCGMAIYFAEWPHAMRAVLIPCSFAFLSTLTREIIKDIEDMEGDRSAGHSTYPIRFGSEAAAKLSRYLLFGILLLLPVPLAFSGYHFSYGLIALAGVIIPLCIALIKISGSSPKWGAAQKSLKVMMLGGMAAIAAGVMF